MTTKKPYIPQGEQVKKYTRPRDGFWFSDDIRDCKPDTHTVFTVNMFGGWLDY